MHLEGREYPIGVLECLAEIIIWVRRGGGIDALGRGLVEPTEDGSEQFGREVGGRLRLAPTVDVVKNLRDEVVGELHVSRHIGSLRLVEIVDYHSKSAPTCCGALAKKERSQFLNDLFCLGDGSGVLLPLSPPLSGSSSLSSSSSSVVNC